MGNVRTPRGAWIEAALEALAAGGPDGVRVEALAAGLGVSKGGFYWHFSDRGALLEETLDSWEQAGTEDVIARIDGRPGDPRAKLRELFELAPTADFAVELAIRDWSRRDERVAARLRRIDNRRMAFLRSLFGEISADAQEADARAMLTYSLLIGSWFIAARDDGRTRSEMLGLAVDRLLD
ncbi:MAG TPA: TetR/AcrR family transcriptional regulator [Solirubrobacteraceae bacterium]